MSTHRASDLVPPDAEIDPLPAPLGGAESCVVSAGVAYFAAYDFLGQRQIWRSDGTPGGTRAMADVPGLSLCDQGRRAIAATHARVIFLAEGGCGASGRIWSTDGTSLGTAPLLSITFSAVGAAASGEQVAYFVATPDGGTPTIWRTDGDPFGAGTISVGPPPAGLSWNDVSVPVVVGDRLYFVLGSDLWRSDGTSAGTERVASGIVSPYGPGRLPVIGEEIGFVRYSDAGALQFLLLDTATDESHLVFERPGIYARGGIDPVRIAGGRWLVEAAGSTREEHWWSDGTPAGTVELLDFIRPDGTSAAESPSPAFLFHYSDGLLGRSDGTRAGTGPIAGSDGIGLPHQGADAGPQVLASERLLFARDDGAHGNEPWVVDPADSTVSLLANLNTAPRGSLSGGVLGAVLGGAAVFGATDDAEGFELWRSDGTSAGTTPVFAPLPAVTPTSLSLMSEARADGVMLFADAVSSPSLTFRLWRSDGTAAGTQLVRSMQPGTGGIIRAIFQVGDGWLMQVGGLSTPALWRSDGTDAGTSEATDLGIQPRLPEAIRDVVAGNVLLFGGQGTSDSAGVELWRTDGTAAGTFRVADLLPGPDSSNPRDFVPDTGRFHALFAAVGTGGASELWGTDGSASGTVRLASFAGAVGGYPASLLSFARVTSAPDSPVMALVGNGYGLELWRVVPPSAPQFVRSWATPQYGTAPRLVAAGSHAYFGAWDASHGEELWVTDGTVARLLLDAGPGAASGFPTYPTAQMLEPVGDRVVFSPCDTKGCEPWVSDGSDQGTRRLMDVNPGFGSSGSRLIARLSDALILSENDGSTGPEPWALRIAALTEPPPVLGDLDGDGDVDAADADLFASAFGKRVGDADFLQSADLDGDGVITLVDYQHWIGEFEAAPTPPPSSTPQPTAEPASIPVFPQSLGGLALALSLAVTALRRMR